LIDPRLLNVRTNYCTLRPLEVADVPLIFDLRSEEREQFLNPISRDIGAQYAYFERYLDRFRAGDEIYYAITDKRLQEDVGVVRLTDILQPSWCNWHSLIVKASASPQVGIDVCATFYAMAFDVLGKNICGPWPVRRSFRKMISLHERMKMAKPVREDDEYYYYQVSVDDFKAHAPALRRTSFGVIEGIHGHD